MMKKYYLVDTGNRFNQKLAFETYEKAVDWCKRCTILDDDEISKIIELIHISFED